VAPPQRAQVKAKSAKNPPAAPARSPAESRRALLRLALEVFAIWLVIHTLFLAGYRIPSESMEPTLLVGDFLFVTPLPYGPHLPFTPWNLPGFTDPKRGTLNVYQSPPQHFDPTMSDSMPIVVKRIVALGGDTIYMRAGVFYVNGIEQRPVVAALPGPSAPNEANPVFDWQHRFELKGSRFGPAPAVITHDDWGPMVVPPGHYFSLGDNRYNSADARYYGFIPRHNFRGRPLIIYFSFDYQDLRLRWQRLGKILWRA
jgi:signal peptidase I